MAVWKPDFGEYDYVWDFICGVTAGNPWPTGNEDDLWDLAAEWAAVSQALGDAMQDAGPVVNDLIAAWGGDSGYSFLGFWEKLGQSPEAGLGAIADMASALSDMSENAALELQYNKLTTLITVLITIISVFTALVAAFFTAGGSAGAIQPIMMGGRVAVQQSFRQLVRNIARKVVEKELRKELLKKLVTKEALKKLGKEAVEELVEEVLEEVVLVDGLTQAYQMASGRRTHWDGSKTAASAIGATAGVPIGMGVAPAAQWAKNRAGKLVTARLSDATIDRINHGIQRVNAPGTHLGGLRKQFAGTPGQAVSIGLVNAVTSPTSSWIANGVVYGNWEYPTDSILSSAFAGASRANTISPPQLAAVTVTHGTTGFRETLLGSHPAALDLGVPTTFQQAPTLAPFQEVAALPLTTDTPTLPTTNGSTAATSAPSPITAALAPPLITDPTSTSFAAAPMPSSDVLFATGGTSLTSSSPLAPAAPGAPISLAATPTPLAVNGASATPGVVLGERVAPTITPSPATATDSPNGAGSVQPTSPSQATALADGAPDRVDTSPQPTPAEAARVVPTSDAPPAPARGPSTDQNPTPSDSPTGPQRPSFTPLSRSAGLTANGTHSYGLPKRQGNVQGDLRRAAVDAARELANAVELTLASTIPSKNKRRLVMPGTAGALVTRDGVIRAHTSMRGGTPAPHPALKPLLNDIRSDLASRKVLPDWHGKCAEVALLSDFLYDYAQTYTGPPGGFLDAARSALVGAEIVSVGIEMKHSHGAHKNPCLSCAQLLPDLGVTAIDAGPAQRRGLPPSIVPTVFDPARGRLIGAPGGMDRPKVEDQKALQESVPRDRYGRPVRFPNPLGRWLGLINDGGPAATAFRANNCLDTALSLLGTWHGNPQVSAPRLAEYTSDRKPSTAGETDGRQRAEETLGATFDYHGNTADSAFPDLARQLLAAGHGASAILITSIDPGHGGGSHAWNAVNHHGTIHWIDAQIGVVSSRPLFDYAVDGVWSIALSPNGQPLRASDPPAVAPGLASIKEEGEPAAQTVPASTFVPEGRSVDLPDLVQGELLAAAAGIRPEDFASRRVAAVDVGDAVTVRLTDGRSVRFEAAVGSGMRELATTAVGRNRNVVTVNARVAPEQLTRVWVHEIAAALQEKRPVGFFRRLVERVGRASGMNALVEARLSERRYLIRSMRDADSASYRALAQELGDLDRYLSDVGVSVRRLPRPAPSVPSGIPVSAGRTMLQPAVSAEVGERPATLDDLGLDDVPQAWLRARMVNPREILFTQRSIGKKTGDGFGLGELAERIGEQWRGAPLHGVRWGDGSLVSIDNRRLTAARRAGGRRIGADHRARSGRIVGGVAGGLVGEAADGCRGESGYSGVA